MLLFFSRDYPIWMEIFLYIWNYEYSYIGTVLFCHLFFCIKVIIFAAQLWRYFVNTLQNVFPQSLIAKKKYSNDFSLRYIRKSRAAKLRKKNRLLNVPLRHLLSSRRPSNIIFSLGIWWKIVQSRLNTLNSKSCDFFHLNIAPSIDTPNTLFSYKLFAIF